MRINIVFLLIFILALCKTTWGLESLIKKKQDLEEQWNKYQLDENYSVLLFREKTQSLLNEMTAYQKEDLLNEVIAGNFNKKESKISQWLRNWNNEYKSYFEKLDEYNLELQNYLIDYTKDYATDFIQKNISYLHPHQKNLFHSILDTHKRYYENLNYYGKGKDYLRMYAFRDFFNQLDKLMSDLELKQSQDENTICYLNYTKLIPSALKILSSFPHSDNRDSDLSVRSQNLAFENQAFKTFLIKLANIHNLKPEVENMEEWPSSWPKINSKTKRPYFHLLTPRHASAIQDSIALCTLPTAPAIIFAAAYNNFPYIMAKAMDRSESFMVVDGDKKKKVFPHVLDKFFESINSKISHVAINFIQGSVPLIGENHPPRKKIGLSLLHQIVKDGFDLKIYPISNITPSNFLSYKTLTSTASTKLFIEKPIGVYEYAFWTYLAGEIDEYQIVLRIIRAHWELRDHILMDTKDPDYFIQNINSKYFSKGKSDH